jgi:hypothetical protein
MPRPRGNNDPSEALQGHLCGSVVTARKYRCASLVRQDEIRSELAGRPSKLTKHLQGRPGQREHPSLPALADDVAIIIERPRHDIMHAMAGA